MEIMKNIINYFLLILILVFGIFFTLEISLRIYLTIKHFKNPHVSYLGKTWYRFENKPINRFDEDLISELIAVDYQKIKRVRWKKGSKITINKNGFRENENSIGGAKKKRKENLKKSLTV